MKTFCLGAAFCISAVFLPWWVTVALGIVMLASTTLYWLAVFGGAAMDILWSAPGMYPWVYTSVFAFLALVAWYLSSHVLE